MEQSGPTSDQRRQHRRQLQQPWPRPTVSGGQAAAGEEAVSVYTLSVYITGGVWRDRGDRECDGGWSRESSCRSRQETQPVLCCASAGDPGERGLRAAVVVGPEGTGHRAVV